MKIISWNINGLRAIIKKDFFKNIKSLDADILGFQETKLQLSQIPPEITNLDYYKYYNCAKRPGYSGTALFSKQEPLNVSYDISDAKFSDEGRIIQAEYKDFILFNVYFPNGQSNDERLKYKLEFYDQFLSHIEHYRTKGKNIIAMGDFNTAHTEIDLTHPKPNSKYSGFLPIERQWIDKLITNGYIDTFRHFNKSPNNYSWWSYMRHARESNIGWRIDYCFVNSEFLDKVKRAFIYSDIYGSDHCPVGIEIMI